MALRVAKAQDCEMPPTRAKRTTSAGSPTSTSTSTSAKSSTKGTSKPKKSSKTASAATTDANTVSCAVCEQIIVEGKDQALYCEGVCNSWFHRYCAGVSVTHFQKLSSSSKPFSCLECSGSFFHEEIQKLRSSVENLQEEITRLQSILSEKQSSPGDLESSCEGDRINPEGGSQDRGGKGFRGGRGGRGGNVGGNNDNARKPSFGTRVDKRGKNEERGGKRNKGRRRQRRVSAKLVESSGDERATAGGNSSSTTLSTKEKSQVEGVRRVWGTMRETTRSSLKYTVMKFSPSSTLVVKRKTIQSEAGEVKRWWFILHDSEEALKALEEMWEAIQMHTGWKLELCYRPADVTCVNNPPVSQPSEFVQLSHNPISIPSEDDGVEQDHSSTSPDPVLPAPEMSPFLEK